MLTTPSRRYETLAELQADLAVIYSNCRTYNSLAGDAGQYFLEAVQLLESKLGKRLQSIMDAARAEGAKQ